VLKNLPTSKVFCIGIGGIGVSGLAELLHQNGVIVVGSDMTKNAQTKRLQSLGITIFDHHDAKNIEGADLVVYSSAVKADNPERIAAVKNNIRLITRGQLLAEVMKLYCGINIAGTHGKTTTSGIIAWIFEFAKQDPTFMIGGVLRDRHSPMHLGGSKFFIAESDESDASFLFLSPTVGVITNIDADHLETYDHDFSNLKKSFLQFANNISSEGFAVVCVDDPVVRELMSHMKCRVITYGFSDDADYQLVDFHQKGLMSAFTVKVKNKSDFKIELNLAGKHNALNASAAIVVAREYHLPDAAVQGALKTFPGMGRRFQPHGEIKVKDGSALLFDDYGHHPAELEATLMAAKTAWPDRRIVMVFQPHRYTRTRDLLPDFVKVLQSVDQLVLTEVYAASEQRIEGADGQALFAAVKKAGANHPCFVSDLSQLPATLCDVLKPNDIVILQGAGNIVTMADVLKMGV
jgi:UDP-N-acetylmuramate--alanine ligase